MTINKINKIRRKINLGVYLNTEIKCFNCSVIRKEQTRGTSVLSFLKKLPKYQNTVIFK